MFKNSLFLVLIVISTSCSSAEPPRVPITEVKDQKVPMSMSVVAKDIEGIPWGMAFVSDDELLITTREGTFKKLNIKTQKLMNIKGAPKVFADGQGGLLDVKPHPDFEKNKIIFYTYSAPEGDKQATRLAQAKLNGDQLIDSKILFTASPFVDSGYHFGSRIAFDGEGHIFISIGERNKRELAQDLSNHYGKVIRLNMDGSVPKDNPFVSKEKAMPEIWSYGHRNPQGIFFDSKTKELWVSEHGPKGGDEINLVKKGANYGWPLATYGREYWGPKVSEHVTYEGTEDPRHVWLPSIAPSFIVRYEGQAFPKWNDSFLVGALALKHLNRVEFKDGKSVKEERYLVDYDDRLRSMALDKNGNIYLGTDSGSIISLNPLTR